MRYLSRIYHLIPPNSGSISLICKSKWYYLIKGISNLKSASFTTKSATVSNK